MRACCSASSEIGSQQILKERPGLVRRHANESQMFEFASNGQLGKEKGPDPCGVRASGEG